MIIFENSTLKIIIFQTQFSKRFSKYSFSCKEQFFYNESKILVISTNLKIKKLLFILLLLYKYIFLIIIVYSRKRVFLIHIMLIIANYFSI